jgi:hypothetical protein
MAQSPKQTTQKPAEPTPASDAGYTEVTLNRPVSVQGHVYRPGEKHVVDQATLAAMGDAVENQKPVTP